MSQPKISFPKGKFKIKNPITNEEFTIDTKDLEELSQDDLRAEAKKLRQNLNGGIVSGG